MKLKEREEDKFFSYLKKIGSAIRKFTLNKKTKIVFGAIILIIVFLIGTFSGLLFFGFFGTLDNPSQKMLDFFHSKGLTGTELREIKMKIEGVFSQNIKIPVNFIKGKFSKPEKIFIDIGFTDYQRIEYKRAQALEKGVLITSVEDYVPAKIRYNNKEANIKLRLKGDMVDHLLGNKWSFRIKVRGNETLFGMKTFSIQNPKTKDYLYEFVFHEALKREGVIALRYNFIEVVINGKNKGIYALEEHFEKELIENNNRREGIIIKFNEDLMWKEMPNIANLPSRTVDFFYSSEIETFDADETLEDPILSKQFEEARNLLEAFRKGSLETHQVFDIDKLAKYFAINTLLSSMHSSKWHNIRFYYNPITSLLEPIGFDGNCVRATATEVMDTYFSGSLYDEALGRAPSWEELIFRDKIFFEKYMNELERVAQKEYLDDLFLELDEEIKRNINIIHKDNVLYDFSPEMFYENLAQISNRLNPVKSANIYLDEIIPSEHKIILSIGNIDILPLEIQNIVYNDSIIFELNQENKIVKSKKSDGPITYQKFEFVAPANVVLTNQMIFDLQVNYKIFGTTKTKSEEILPWRYFEEDFLEEDFIRNETNLSSFEFLNINEDSKSIYIKKGLWKLSESLTIPEGFDVFCEGGTTIDLINGATILSYSPVHFFGEENNLIKIISSDKSGQGFAVLNAYEKSNLEHVVFSDLTNPSKKGWELTGAITFYESPVKLNNVYITNMNAEDSLNIVRTEYEIENSVFENCFSDCLDGDFGKGIIKDSLFTNCGNDCVDFSGALVNITNIEIFNAGDKGISAGENSNLIVKDVKIIGGPNKSYIGIASKDKSFIFAENIQLSNIIYGFAVYQKKPEFGPASIEANNVTFSNLENEHLVEKDSNLLMNNVIILGNTKDVYKELYGG